MTQRPMIPPRESITICFAHPAYQFDVIFERRCTGIKSFQVYHRDKLDSMVGEAHVLVISGFWKNGLLGLAPKLRFIQTISAGYEQFPLEALTRRGIRLANASGGNRNAVSEHAITLILTLARQTHIDRDNQHRHFWRGMISDVEQRQDEVAGKTLGIIGLGAIGSRIANIGKAMDMKVVAVKRNPATAQTSVDAIYPPDRLPELLRESDFVVLSCPLTDETRGVIDEKALAQMKPSAYLINVARGACVDQYALVRALEEGKIAGAGLDTFAREPLEENSPLWDMENVVVTPHTAGETRSYEDRIIDYLMENLERLWRGESQLINQVV